MNDKLIMIAYWNKLIKSLSPKILIQIMYNAESRECFMQTGVYNVRDPLFSVLDELTAKYSCIMF